MELEQVRPVALSGMMSKKTCLAASSEMLFEW